MMRRLGLRPLSGRREEQGGLVQQRRAEEEEEEGAQLLWQAERENAVEPSGGVASCLHLSQSIEKVNT